MEQAASVLGMRHSVHVLVKGGHLLTSQSSDVLFNYEDNSLHWFRAKRIPSKNTHGTGCSLSAAIASFLAQDYTLVDAIQAAKTYLTHAIASGSTLTIGRGAGPVDHFYFLSDMKMDIHKGST